MKNLSFFENIKLYVGFTEASSAALRELHPIAAPYFQPTVDDFYAAIEAHPGARQAITGGKAQIDRLKQTLIRWMDKMLLGPHDEEYYELRARIGRMHVRIVLPQQYMFTAMDRIRVRLLDVIRNQITGDAAKVDRIATALNQILDLELAIMLETYREDLEAKHRNAERLATIGQFAASIGHELRNPLGVVESSLYLLRQHLRAEADAPPVKKHLDRIGSEVQRANKTIHDLLDLARNRPPQKRPTSLHELVDSAAEAALLPVAITLHVSVPADLAPAIDPDQVRQLLVNLFTNAAQALEGRGQIWVEGGSRARPGRAPARSRRRSRHPTPGSRAHLRGAVHDEGEGQRPRPLALPPDHGGARRHDRVEPGSGGASFLLTFPGLAEA